MYVTKSNEKRIFKIDVKNLSVKDIDKFMKEIVESMNIRLNQIKRRNETIKKILGE